MPDATTDRSNPEAEDRLKSPVASKNFGITRSLDIPNDTLRGIGDLEAATDKWTKDQLVNSTP